MLSVIIPVYNGEKYIEQCLESVIKQGNIIKEVLVINDGSTDHTERIIKKLAEKYSVIHFYSRKNGGVSEARNYGLSLALGKYVWFLDADDVLLESAAEKLINRMETARAEIGMGNVFYYFDETHEKRKTDIWMEDAVWTERRIEIMNYYEIPSNKAFKREFLLANHLEFPRLKIGEDTCFFSKCVAKSSCIVTMESCIGLYRVHNTSASRKYNLSVLGKIAAFKEIEEFFLANDMGAAWMESLTFNELFHYRDVLKKIPLYAKAQERKEVFRSFQEAFLKLNPEELKGNPRFQELIKEISFYLRVRRIYESQAVSVCFRLARDGKHFLKRLKNRI